jgi:hypothetical protein
MVARPQRDRLGGCREPRAGVHTVCVCGPKVRLGSAESGPAIGAAPAAEPTSPAQSW